MTRTELYRAFDELLDEMGFEEKIDMKWGSLNLTVSFQGGKPVMIIREKETQKI